MSGNLLSIDPMSMESTQVEIDTRERILVTAERLFREIGYQKTTVADIAKVLRMSPANIYRFFDSKKTIHEGVARRLMGEVETTARAIAGSDEPAPAKLRRLLATVHEMNSARYVADSKMHEMVAIAMEENWEVCEAHMLQIGSFIGQVIAEGAAAGVFHVTSIETAAMCVSTAMMRFFHPQMIAECARKQGPTLDQMADFVIAGLSTQTP